MNLDRSGGSVGDSGIGANLAPPRGVGNKLLTPQRSAGSSDPAATDRVGFGPRTCARIEAPAPAKLTPSSPNLPWNIASSGAASLRDPKLVAIELPGAEQRLGQRLERPAK